MKSILSIILTLLACEVACAQVTPAWHFDISDARAKALSSNRLLIVAQFENDFHLSPQGSADLINYCHHSMNDESRQWLSENGVLVAQNIGRPANFFPPDTSNALEKETTSGHSIGKSITWICSPKGRVLFCLPGYPDADLLLKKLAWLDELRTLTNDNAGFMAAKQIDAIEKEDHRFYLSLLRQPSKDRKDRSKNEEKSIELAVMAVATARQRRLEQRFGSDRSKEQLKELTESLNFFATFEGQFMHSLFSTKPDLQLAAIQKPVWRHLAQTRLWHCDKRESLTWLKAQQEKKMPLLLRCESGSNSAGPWPPENPHEVKALLGEFAIRGVTVDEFTFLASRLTNKTFQVPLRQSPSFLVATSDGSFVHLLTNRDSYRKLTDTMGPVLEREIYQR